MKRLLLLIFTALIVFAVNAQQSFTYFRTTPSTVTLPAGNGWWRYYNPDHKIQVRIDGSLHNIATESWSLSQFWKTSGTSTLTGDVDVQGTDFGVDFDFTFGTDYSWGYWKSDQVYFGMADENFEHISGLQLQKGAAKLEAGAVGGGYMSMTLATGGTPAILINASGLGTFRGITLPGTFNNADLVAKSLVPKDYVDGLVAGATVADGDKGDVVVSGTGTSWLLDATLNKAWTGTHSFLDNNFSLLDNTDNTKIAKFELSSIATGTTRTLTVPDISGTLVTGTGSNNRIALWNGTNGVTSDSDFSYDGATQGNVLNLNGSNINAALRLISQTAATVGVQQNSPALFFEGNGWKTDATAASQSVRMGMYLVPVQGASAPTSRLAFASSVNGAAFADIASITSGGTLSIFTINSLSGSTALSFAAGQSFGSNGGVHEWRVLGGTQGPASALVIPTGNYTSTSGVQNLLRIGNASSSFTVSSGTASFAALRLNMVHNTTGTYSGNIYGLDIDPTNTSLTGATYYAIRTTSGQTLLANSSSDVATANTRLSVRGISGGNIISLMANDGSARLTLTDAGSGTVTNGWNMTGSNNAWNNSSAMTSNNSAAFVHSATLAPNGVAIGSFRAAGTISPSTGSNEITSFHSNNTINTSGGTNTIRGFYYNPGLSGTTGSTIYSFASTYGLTSFVHIGSSSSGTTVNTFDGGAYTHTSGVSTFMNVTGSYTAASGGGGIFGIRVQPTIDQTSTANGSSSAYQSNPTYTSLLGTFFGFNSGGNLTASSGSGSVTNFNAGGTITTSGTHTGIWRGLHVHPNESSVAAGTDIRAVEVEGRVYHRDASSLGGVTGSGVATRLAVWDGTGSQTSYANIGYDNTTNDFRVTNFVIDNSSSPTIRSLTGFLVIEDYFTTTASEATNGAFQIGAIGSRPSGPNTGDVWTFSTGGSNYTEVYENSRYVRMGRTVHTTVSSTLTLSDIHDVVFCQTNSFTVNLPAAASNAGTEYTIKNITGGTTITVDPNSTETVDGASTYSLASQYKYVTIKSDGNNWQIIGNN
jgi:hypothetical protein